MRNFYLFIDKVDPGSQIPVTIGTNCNGGESTTILEQREEMRMVV